MTDNQLNQMLTVSGPINFKVLTKLDIVDLKKKDGGTYQKQNVCLEIPATGEKLMVQMFPKFVAYLTEGGSVRGVCDEKYPKWEFVDATGDNPKETNTRQVKNERAATTVIPVINEAASVHDWKLGLAGIVQAMIASGGYNDHEITGVGGNLDKKKTASEWAQWIRTKAQELGSQTHNE